MPNHSPNQDRVALAATIERLSADLATAQADIDLLTRLKNAEADAQRLAKEIADAQERLVTAIADEVLAKRNQMFAGFDGINITVRFPSEAAHNVLSANYIITYKRLSYDHNRRESAWMEQTVRGFAALPSDVYAYLMEVKPSAIPAIIMDLAPGDPARAMELYLRGMQRGYLTSAAA